MKRWQFLGAAVTSVVIGSLIITSPGSQAAPGLSLSGADPRVADKASLVADNSLRGQLGLSRGEQLVLKDVVRDADGTVHKRFDRKYEGLSVIGGDLIVHTSDGRTTVDWGTRADLGAVSTTPRISASTAAGIAADSTDLRSRPGDAELVVYAVGNNAELAWKTAATGKHAHEYVFVDATSGKELAGWSAIHEAQGTGKTLYSGNRRITTQKVDPNLFRLRDIGRGNFRVFDANHTNNDPPTGTLFTDVNNVWGNNQPANQQSAAADVAYGHRVTWDFYKNVLNRDGIRDNGSTPRAYVHQGVSYENAFYDDACYCIVFGDGGATFRPLVSLDVVSHELSHGTTADTAGLIYLGESGGLNEASSDIFGTMAEFYGATPQDRGDYYVGEEIVKVAPNFLRRMDRPAADAPLYGGAASSYNCWTATMGADDVHFTSGPANHWFYLLAEGNGHKLIGGRHHNSPTCDGSNIEGIGRTPAGKIWYRALNVYMVSTTNYIGARDATIRAARDLYGAGSPKCKRVVKAWNAVDVPVGDRACTGAPTPKGPNAVDNPGFEAGDNGDWTDVPNNLITSSLDFFPRAGSWYAWLGGHGGTATDTLSQSITVPNSPNAKLRYWVAILSNESPSDEFDTLEVRIHDGSTHVVQTRSNQHANNTYTQRTVDVSDWAGETVTLRFVAEEDSSVATWFFLDDVRVNRN